MTARCFVAGTTPCASTSCGEPDDARLARVDLDADGDLHVELTLLAGQMRGVVLETGHRDHRAKSECPRPGTL